MRAIGRRQVWSIIITVVVIGARRLCNTCDLQISAEMIDWLILPACRYAL